MSLCFGLNLEDSVLLLADSRITKNHSSGAVSEVGFDFFPKIQPLTRRSVLFISGLIEASEIIRFEVRSKTHGGTTLEELSNLIQFYSLMYGEKFKHLRTDEDMAVSASVLAYYDTEPHLIAFSHGDNYKPYALDVGQFGFRGIGQDIAWEHFNSNLKVDSDIIGLVYKTFKFVNSENSAVGGVFGGYLINKDGIQVVSGGMI